MFGRIYSANLTSATDADLFTQIETALGVGDIVAKKITLISASLFTYDISKLGVFSAPYFDSIDSMYKISTENEDAIISSCIIHENAIDIWVAIEF